MITSEVELGGAIATLRDHFDHPSVARALAQHLPPDEREGTVLALADATLAAAIRQVRTATETDGLSWVWAEPAAQDPEPTFRMVALLVADGRRLSIGLYFRIRAFRPDSAVFSEGGFRLALTTRSGAARVREWMNSSRTLKATLGAAERWSDLILGPV